MSTIPPDALEAKEHCELELYIRDSLENKANSITTVSGTVATLLFGFGQFLIERLAQLQYAYIGFITGLLFVGVFASALAIILCVCGVFGYKNTVT